MGKYKGKDLYFFLLIIIQMGVSENTPQFDGLKK